MNEEKRLPSGAMGFLFVVALMADGIKIALDFLFGVGFILDPLLITPFTLAVYWIVYNHNGVPMFSGKRAAAGWINLVVSLCPVIDIIPDWTIYTIYMWITDRIGRVFSGGIIS